MKNCACLFTGLIFAAPDQGANRNGSHLLPGRSGAQYHGFVTQGLKLKKNYVGRFTEPDVFTDNPEREK